VPRGPFPLVAVSVLLAPAGPDHFPTHYRDGRDRTPHWREAVHFRSVPDFRTYPSGFNFNAHAWERDAGLRTINDLPERPRYIERTTE
jgi:hypothetical protein